MNKAEELRNLDRIFTKIVAIFCNEILDSNQEINPKYIFKNLEKAAFIAYCKKLIEWEEMKIFVDRKKLAKPNSALELMTKATEQLVFDYCFS